MNTFKIMAAAAVAAWLFAGGYVAGSRPIPQAQGRTMTAPAYTFSYTDERDGWAFWMAVDTEDEARGLVEHFGGSYSRGK